MGSPLVFCCLLALCCKGTQHQPKQNLIIPKPVSVITVIESPGSELSIGINV